MFGDAIDYGRVRVHRRAWWPLQPRNAVMAPDGDIWCHPKGSAWRLDYAEASAAMQQLFIHEMTHVWQAQRGGRWYLPLVRHPFCRYAYRLTPGKPFARYGVEQQAEIVAHAFRARLIGAPWPPLEALLPFRENV
ncbi:MAG TPA: vgr related protein [Sphingomonas sp.]